jgi:hypothetical protein
VLLLHHDDLRQIDRLLIGRPVLIAGASDRT